MAAPPRYIYASTARRRRPYPLIAGGSILAVVLAELLLGKI